MIGKHRLNLGCGARKREGYVNVDAAAACAPDLVFDLESLPWPWEDDSVGQVLLIHVLEHLGQTPSSFLGIMKELWRVCCNSAEILIEVPHPRSDEFLGDPTHVRPITADVLALFSQRDNRTSAQLGAANTPLGMYLGVDFEIVQSELIPRQPWLQKLQRGEIDENTLREAGDSQWNVYAGYRALLRVIKPAGATFAVDDQEERNRRRDRVNQALACGDHAGAVADLRALFAENPADQEIRYQLAMCMHSTGDFEEARSHYRYLFDAGVHTYELLINFGVVNQELGDPALAALCYEAALELVPGDRIARSNLAEAKALAGDLRSALGLFETLIMEDPGDAAVALAMARVLITQRLFDDAENALNLARRSAGESTEVVALASVLATARRSADERSIAGK